MAAITPALLSRLADDAGFKEATIVVHALHSNGGPVIFAAGPALSPASMIKVPIAFALEDFRARGALSLEDRIEIAASNMTANDAPSPFVPGYSARFGELARAMLAASDNVATNVLIDVLGRGEIGEACARLGLEHTHVRRKLSGSLPLIEDPGAAGRNAHPPEDAAALFARLASPEGPAWIWNALAEQYWNDKLSRGFEPFATFAHKTGDTDEVSHDGGVLVFPDGRRSIVVVYTALGAKPESDALHAAFARALRPHLIA